MRLLVPAYGYPTEAPGLWAGLCQSPALLEAAIVNVHDGPGCVVDPNYTSAIAELRAAGVPMAAYVDLGYGGRSSGEVLKDARVWSSRYGIEALFLDQVPSAWSPQLAHLADRLRSAGSTRLIANPGTSAAPGVAALFDLVVEREHAGTAWPERSHTTGSDTAWILHGTPPSELERVLARAEARGVTAIWVTDLDGPNPYRALPSYWDRLAPRPADRALDRDRGAALPLAG
jgi:hypothetical protein